MMRQQSEQALYVDLGPSQHPHVSLEQFHQYRHAQEHLPAIIKRFIDMIAIMYKSTYHFLFIFTI